MKIDEVVAHEPSRLTAHRICESCTRFAGRDRNAPKPHGHVGFGQKLMVGAAPIRHFFGTVKHRVKRLSLKSFPFSACAANKRGPVFGNNSKRMKADDLMISRESQPEWKTGLEKLPGVGEVVMCTSGMAEVVRLLGKTSDGSRLLELRLVAEKAPPFFAAASNVLVRPA